MLRSSSLCSDCSILFIQKLRHESARTRTSGNPMHFACSFTRAELIDFACAPGIFPFSTMDWPEQHMSARLRTRAISICGVLTSVAKIWTCRRGRVKPIGQTWRLERRARWSQSIILYAGTQCDAVSHNFWQRRGWREKSLQNTVKTCGRDMCVWLRTETSSSVADPFHEFGMRHHKCTPELRRRSRRRLSAATWLTYSHVFARARAAVGSSVSDARGRHAWHDLNNISQTHKCDPIRPGTRPVAIRQSLTISQALWIHGRGGGE